MKFWLPSRLVVGILASLFLLLALSAQAKLIHLRNAVIPTKSMRQQAPAKDAAAQAPASGLYLIQFTAPLTPEAKAQLKGLGISLFHYVPKHKHTW